MWRCEICKKPEVTKEENIVIVGCPHFAILTTKEEEKDES